MQRKAKQITANLQSNIVEENKALVLPALRELAGGLSEEQACAKPKLMHLTTLPKSIRLNSSVVKLKRA